MELSPHKHRFTTKTLNKVIINGTSKLHIMVANFDPMQCKCLVQKNKIKPPLKYEKDLLNNIKNEI